MSYCVNCFSTGVHQPWCQHYLPLDSTPAAQAARLLEVLTIPSDRRNDTTAEISRRIVSHIVAAAREELSQ